MFMRNKILLRTRLNEFLENKYKMWKYNRND